MQPQQPCHLLRVKRILQGILKIWSSRFFSWVAAISICTTGVLIGTPMVQAQIPLLPELLALTSSQAAAYPVWFDGYKLFHLAVPSQPDESSAIFSITGRLRANEIQDRLYSTLEPSLDPSTLSLRSQANDQQTVIYVSANTVPSEQVLMTVTPLDAQLSGGNTETRAEELMVIIEDGLKQAHQERQPRYLIRQAAKVLIVTSLAIALISLMRYYQRKLRQRSRLLNQQTSQFSDIPSVPGHAPALQRRSTWLALHNQFGLQQQIDVNLLKRRVIQIGQLAVVAIAFWVCFGFFPYTRWLQPFIFSKPLNIIGIGLLTYIGIKVLWVLIDKFFSMLERGRSLSNHRAPQRFTLRITTLSWVLKSVAASLSVSIGLFLGLLVLGIDLLPLIAGLGAFALAISLAAQHIVRDVLNGLLILLEDQYAVGDVIVVGDVGGFVESMTLRLTQLRNDEGRLISIPHSAISVVQNLSKEWSRVDFTIDVAYDVPIDQSLSIMREVAECLYQEPQWQDVILEPPELLGIDEMDHAGLLVRMWFKTKPLEQWNVAREFRYRLKQAFEREGIWVGMPQQGLGFRNMLELRSSTRSLTQVSPSASTVKH